MSRERSLSIRKRMTCRAPPRLLGALDPTLHTATVQRGEFHPPCAPTERWAGDDSTHFPPFVLYRPKRSILYPPTATRSRWTAPHADRPATRVPRADPSCEEPHSLSRCQAGPIIAKPSVRYNAHCTEPCGVLAGPPSLVGVLPWWTKQLLHQASGKGRIRLLAMRRARTVTNCVSVLTNLVPGCV